MQLKLPGIDNRKNLGAERAAAHGNNCAADDEIGEHDEASSFHQHVCKPIVCGTQPIEKGVSCGFSRVPPLRSIQTASTGTKVLDSTYDPTIEKPTARASGTKRLCAAPVMKKAGMNTARMHSIATNRGNVVSAVASLAARARLSRRVAILQHVAGRGGAEGA